MTKDKTQKFKEFLITVRKTRGSGTTNAPVWAMQKAQKRIWNMFGKRHWRSTDFGQEFRTQEKRASR
ncbi:MAG: hypothetical protein Q7K42_05200 [Candidatus Diapherotrites archaeon]|nr:hypothetical protein [Candidatus Diapherotrites archaeon]